MANRLEFMDAFNTWKGVDAIAIPLTTPVGDPSYGDTPWILNDYRYNFGAAVEDYANLCADTGGLLLNEVGNQYILAPSMNSVYGLYYYNYYTINFSDDTTLPPQSVYSMTTGHKVSFGTDALPTAQGGALYAIHNRSQGPGDLGTADRPLTQMTLIKNPITGNIWHGWFRQEAENDELLNSVVYASDLTIGTLMQGVIGYGDTLWTLYGGDIITAECWAYPTDLNDGTQGAGVDLTTNVPFCRDVTRRGDYYYVLAGQEATPDTGAANIVIYDLDFALAAPAFATSGVVDISSYTTNPQALMYEAENDEFYVLDALDGVTNEIRVLDVELLDTEETFEVDSEFTNLIQSLTDRLDGGGGTCYALLGNRRIRTMYKKGAGIPGGAPTVNLSGGSGWGVSLNQYANGIYDDGMSIWTVNSSISGEVPTEDAPGYRIFRWGVPLRTDNAVDWTSTDFITELSWSTDYRIETVFTAWDGSATPGVDGYPLAETYIDGVKQYLTDATQTIPYSATDEVDPAAGCYCVELRNTDNYVRAAQVGVITDFYMMSDNDNTDGEGGIADPEADLLGNWRLHTLRPTGATGDFRVEYTTQSAQEVTSEQYANCRYKEGYLRVSEFEDTSILLFEDVPEITGTIEWVMFGTQWNRDDRDSAISNFPYDEHSVTLAAELYTTLSTGAQHILAHPEAGWGGFLHNNTTQAYDNDTEFSPNGMDTVISKRVYEVNPSTGVAWTVDDIAHLKLKLTTSDYDPYYPFPF